MVGLRCREGVNLERLARQECLAPALLDRLRARLGDYERRGLLRVEGPRWRLADPQGLALSNGVLREMLAWWQELEQTSPRAQPAPAP
jgi:coproporphyrinogen III oxidase-like Fe-S oxidoreductase